MADLNTQLVFGANTAGAEAGVRTVKRSLKELADTATSAGKSIEGVGDRAGKSLEGMGDGAEVAARKIQRDTNSMKGSLQRYLSTLEAGSKDSRKYWESMADFKGIDKTALRPLLDQLDAYNAKAKGAQETTTSWVGSLGRMGASAAGVAAVAATAGVAAKAMFEASASAERLRTMLDFSTGGNSGKEIEYLRDVTYRLGLEFASTAKAYGQFSAAAKGTTLEGDKARAVFESVAKASAVMGLSASDTSGVLLALQQMLSKGTVSAEELRGQLGERLPGSFQVAAKAMGVTTAELGKMLEQGEVIADDFLPKFAAALEKNIGGASEKAAQRLDASVNRVATAWERLKQNGGDSGTSSFMAGQYEILADGFNGISEAMERARASGSGFIGQMVSGAAAAAKFANPLQAVSYSAIETGNALKQAEAEFAALQKRGDVMGGNIYYKAEMANLAALIKELKAAQAEKQKLATGAAPNMNEGVNASGRAREAYNSQRAKDEEAANAFRLNQSGVPASYLKDMAELIRLNQAGVIVGKEYNDALKKQQDILLKKTGVTKGASASAKQEVSEYDKLIKKLSDELPKAAAEAEAAQMGYNKAQTEFLALAGSPAWASFSNSQRAVVASMFEGKIASEEAGEAAKALSKSYAEAAAERIKTIQSMERAADSLQSQNDALREEIELIGLSTEQQTLVLQQRNDVIILTKEATLAEFERQSAITGTQTRVEIALASEIEALKERNALLGAKGVKNAAVDAAKTAKDEWQKTTDSINQSLTDSLLRGFESGKDFAKNFADTIKNLFKTMVLRPVISAIVNPIAGAVTGAMGFSGAANAATGGGGIMGMASNASSAYNLVSGGGAFAGALGSGFTMGMGGLGSMGVALEGGAAMLGSATGVSSALAGIGQIAGALGPIALGIGAIAGLASLFGSKSTQEYGAVANYSAASGLQTAKGGYENNAEWRNFGTGFGGVAYEQGIATQVSSITQSIVTALDATAKTFGQTVGYEAAAGFASDFGEEATWGGLRIALQGMDLVNWDNNRQSKWAPREFDSGEEGYKQYLAAIAQDTRQVLLDMDLPSWADTILTSIGEAASMDQLSAALQQIGAIKATFEQLGKSIEGFAGITGGMETALLKAAGGIDALKNSAGTYYENFYSDAEKTAAVTRQVSDALASVGLQMPATREEFRALVESQMALGEGSAQAVAALLGVSGAFASVTESAEEAARATAMAAWSAAKSQVDASSQQAQFALAAVDSAYEAVQRAVDAQRYVVQETIDDTRAVFETLRENVRSLYGEVEGTAAMQAAQGRAFISQALGTAQTTGYLPDGQQLQDAIGAARSGLQSQVYATQAEADFQRLVLAGELKDLQDISGDQLTEAEKQLRALDNILGNARAQLDALNGIDTSIMSVEAAIQSLADAVLAALSATKSAQQVNSSYLSSGVYHGNGTVTTTSGATVAVSEFVGKTDAARADAYLASNPDVAAAWATSNTYGMSAEEFATVHYALYGIDEGRKFAKGGYYPGGMALVGEQGPELINFSSPGQVYTAEQTNNLMGGNTARLEALVEGLTAEVQRLQAIVNDGNREQRRTANAVNGNPDMPMLVQTI